MQNHIHFARVGLCYQKTCQSSWSPETGLFKDFVQADLVTLLQCFYSEIPSLKIINMSEKELLLGFHSKKKKKKEKKWN